MVAVKPECKVNLSGRRDASLCISFNQFNQERRSQKRTRKVLFCFVIVEVKSEVKSAAFSKLLIS